MIFIIDCFYFISILVLYYKNDFPLRNKGLLSSYLGFCLLLLIQSIDIYFFDGTKMLADMSIAQAIWQISTFLLLSIWLFRFYGFLSLLCLFYSLGLWNKKKGKPNLQSLEAFFTYKLALLLYMMLILSSYCLPHIFLYFCKWVITMLSK